MIVFLWIFSFYFTFDTTHSFSPKSVNMELEASVVLEPGDMFPNQNFNILRNAQEVFNTIQRVFRTNDFNLDVNEEIDNSEVLDDFIKKLTNALLEYNSDSLKYLAQTLYLEMKGFRDSALAVSLNPKLKDYAIKKLVDWAYSNPAQLISNLEKFNKDNFTKTFLIPKFKGYLNKTDSRYLNKIVQRLQTYSNNKKNVMKTVRNALKFLFFQRYDNMTEYQKQELAEELNIIAEFMTNNNKHEELSYDFKDQLENGIRKSALRLPSGRDIKDIRKEKGPKIAVNNVTQNTEKANKN